MTGYGKTVVAFEGKKINVEIKSLNSKQLDLSTRIAPLYREKEMEIRQLIAERIQGTDGELLSAAGRLCAGAPDDGDGLGIAVGSHA